MAVLEIKNLTKRYGRITALDNINLTIEAGNIYGLLGPNGSGKTTTLGIILGILRQNSGSFKWFDGQYGEKYRMRIGAILETPNFYPYLDADTNGLDPEGIAEVRNILQRVADTGKTVIMASHLLDEVEKICTHAVILKNGKLLSTGPVGTILNDDVTIEVAAENNEALKQILGDVPWINSVNEVRGNILECTAESSHNGSEINALAFQKGIVITHLKTRKRSLEEEFLEITGLKS